MTTAEALVDPASDIDDDVLAARREYANAVYPRLEEAAAVSMPDFTIHRVLGRFPEWSYEVKRIRGQAVHYFHRQFGDPELEFVPLPEEEKTPRRIIGHDKQGGLGVAVVDRVFGDDLRCIVGIEKQLLVPVTAEIRQQRIRRRFAEKAEKFKTASGELLEGALFTEQEKIAMSLLTHLGPLKDIHTALDAPSSHSVSKPLQAAYKRVGIPSSKTALTELMLVAVAAGIASIDHIPRGRTSDLDALDREVLHAYYHPDPAERAAARNQYRSRKGGRMGRMHDKSGIQGKRMLIMCAVKDGIIELPNITDFQPAEQRSTAA